MSWKNAKLVASKLMAELLSEFPPGMVRMILRAMERELNKHQKIAEANETETEH